MASGCKKQFLPPEEMARVLYDFIGHEVFLQDFASKDSSIIINAYSAKFQDSIFAKHGVTKAEFIRSYDYYQHEPEKFFPILDSISARASRASLAPIPGAVHIAPLADSTDSVKTTIFTLDSTGKRKFNKKKL